MSKQQATLSKRHSSLLPQTATMSNDSIVKFRPFDKVECCFDIVERIVQLAAFDSVAWTLLLVWTGLCTLIYCCKACRRLLPVYLTLTCPNTGRRQWRRQLGKTGKWSEHSAVGGREWWSKRRIRRGYNQIKNENVFFVVGRKIYVLTESWKRREEIETGKWGDLRDYQELKLVTKINLWWIQKLS